MSLQETLSKSFRLPEIEDKKKAYIAVADELTDRLAVDEVVTLVEHLVNKEGGEQAGRTYVTPFVLDHVLAAVSRVDEEEDEDAPDGDDGDDRFYSLEDRLSVAQRIVDVVRPKRAHFKVQLMKAVDLLSQCYQGEGDYKKAAHALSSFKFDDDMQVTPLERLDWVVRTTQLYLEADCSGEASQAIKRGHAFVNDVPKDHALFILFRSCYAQVQDITRSFLNAAREYSRISQMFGLIDEGELLTTLKFAVTCAILAEAGPERTRLLATLYSDERVHQLPNFPMLEKMFKDQIVRSLDVEKFKALLQPHQNAHTGTGHTVLENAVMQHNMLSARKIYKNIRFSELGELLEVSSQEAEELARSMIEKRALEGTIDQVEGLLEFSDNSGTLVNWDAQIQGVCLDVNSVLEKVSKANPEYEY